MHGYCSCSHHSRAFSHSCAIRLFCSKLRRDNIAHSRTHHNTLIVFPDGHAFTAVFSGLRETIVISGKCIVEISVML